MLMWFLATAFTPEGKQAPKIEDFMPNFDQPEPDIQSPDEIANFFKGVYARKGKGKPDGND